MCNSEHNPFNYSPGAGGQEERERLRRFMWEHAFKVGEFRLASGKKSSYYFNSKNVILSAEGAYLVARAMLDKIRDLEVDAIGGAAMGAVPLAGALAPLCYLEGRGGISFFVDRKKPKEHGDEQRVEGPAPESGAQVVIVEDVVTTGGSALDTALYMREQGCEVVKIVALLDRCEGGEEAFQQEGFAFDPVFTVYDFLEKT